MDDLERLLAAGDMRAVECLRECEPLLAAALGQAAAPLAGQIAAFDFEAALATLLRARGQPS
jgi:hypothetical protein